ncbi:MAG: glucose-1-phosphate adenylyltransferase subunit GlgD [Oscillospiraceae bacterium]|nr:glucose-1-phosphate adenylyltransferase subunit GlgD [Oscillospiraceae bacterium]
MKAMGIIFGSVYDASLGDLTNKRTMASLPFAGRYRQIDFTLSNMTNSGIGHVGIVSKHNYQSLMGHIGSGQSWDLELGESLDFLTPYATGSASKYRGKLDALNANKVFLELSPEEYVILADSAVLCSIDLSKVLAHHIASGVDVTMVVKEGVANGSKQLDLAVLADAEDNVTDIAVDYCAEPEYLASMGIYVLKREYLLHACEEAVARSRYHLERDFLLREFAAGKMKANVYRFPGVALFNENTEEYYRNSLRVLDEDVRHDLFHPDRTIYTRPRNETPAYVGPEGKVNDSIIGDGSVINGQIDHSVIFRGCHVDRNALVRDSILLQDVNVGAGAQLSCVILDKDVRVRPGARLVGTPAHPVIVKRGEVV